MNTKKINELTMMETVSDAANVLVEENGEAKRIPPGKMVAGSLPEHLQFGETAVGGDTLTWDGNTEGLVVVEEDYKVSDATFSSGMAETIILSNGTTTRALTGSDLEPDYDLDAYFFRYNGAPVVTSFGPSAASIIGCEPGTYFRVFQEEGITWFVSSVTLSGVAPFPTFKPLDKKYLPGDLIPAYTAADEGKVLKIVNGAPAWVSIPSAEEASF